MYTSKRFLVSRFHTAGDEARLPHCHQNCKLVPNKKLHLTLLPSISLFFIRVCYSLLNNLTN